MHHLRKLPLVLLEMAGVAAAAAITRRKAKANKPQPQPETKAKSITRIGLVGCVKTKRHDGPMPAKDLYASHLFLGRRAHAEHHNLIWYILSAEHGLLDPNQVIDYYDNTLMGKPVAHKRAWANNVLQAIDALDLDYENTIFEIQAGSEYRNFGLVEGLQAKGATVEVPFEGLSQGEQLAAYKLERSA